MMRRVISGHTYPKNDKKKFILIFLILTILNHISSLGWFVGIKNFYT